jgi:hypothetical protein
MAPMKDETVLFNPASNQFCVLNKTAAFIWSRLERPQTVDEICAALSASFSNVEGKGVAADVQKMLTDMQQASCVIATND